MTAKQIAKLNELTRDLPETKRIVDGGKDGTVKFASPMNSNDIVLVKLMPIRLNTTGEEKPIRITGSKAWNYSSSCEETVARGTQEADLIQ